YLRDDLEKLAKEKLKSNIEWEFKGNVPNQEIIKFYQSEPVSLFIHTSDTEGLCLAIIEAQSFGIPGMAVITGGVADVVNDSSGIKISLSDSPEIISQKIIEFKTSSKNSEEFRNSVKEHWKNK